MSKERLVNAVIPRQHPKTIAHFTQLKNFVDASIKEAINQKDEDKVSYLSKALFQVRDYLFAEINENALRIQIIEEFQRLEAEEAQAKEVLGNPASASNELEQQTEQLAQDPRDYQRSGLGEL
jgi:hypothetical protein